MIPVYPPPVPTWYAVTLIVGLVGFVVWLFAFDGPRFQQERDARVAHQERALEMWLKDCQAYNPLEACASAWDRSPTLRGIYFDKARAP